MPKMGTVSACYLWMGMVDRALSSLALDGSLDGKLSTTLELERALSRGQCLIGCSANPFYCKICKK